MDALLDALHHLRTHDTLAVNRAKVVGSAAHDFRAIIGLGVPVAPWNETIVLLHRNLLLLNKEERLTGHSVPYGQRTSGGIEDRMASTLPPVLRPKVVPRS